MKGHRICVLLVGLMVIGATLSSCTFHQWVGLSGQRYIPKFRYQYKAYRGLPVVVSSVINEDEATTTYYFYSGDRYFSYYTDEGDLSRFYWSCFGKALSKAGMRVKLKHNIDPKVPTLQFTLRSTSDLVLEIGVKVYVKKRLVFEQSYTHEVTQKAWEKRTASGYLERISYEMITRVVEKILADRAFARSIVRRQHLIEELPSGTPTHTGRPTTGGCTKDTDCKGNRICTAGSCVNPR